jgi:hypothetical protein
VQFILLIFHQQMTSVLLPHKYKNFPFLCTPINEMKLCIFMYLEVLDIRSLLDKTYENNLFLVIESKLLKNQGFYMN